MSIASVNRGCAKKVTANPPHQTFLLELMHTGAAGGGAAARYAPNIGETMARRQNIFEPRLHEAPRAHVARLFLHPAKVRGVRIISFPLVTEKFC